MRSNRAGEKRRAMGAENLRIRLEAHLRAAPVMHLADSLERRHRMAALEDLAIQICPRATSTSSRSDRALTTETPTPCRPPEVS